MKLTADNRGISFHQTTWMKPYIAKNTELKKNWQTVLRKTSLN